MKRITNVLVNEINVIIAFLLFVLLIGGNIDSNFLITFFFSFNITLMILLIIDIKRETRERRYDNSAKDNLGDNPFGDCAFCGKQASLNYEYKGNALKVCNDCEEKLLR